MSPSARRTAPDPAPKTGIARRLEQIRHQNGIISRRAFWERIKDEWDEDEAGRPAPSYASVKLWHFDREPPISYLACAAKVFGVRFVWLLTGEGEMTEADQQAENDVAGASFETMVQRMQERRAQHLKIDFLQALGVLPDDIDADDLAAGLSPSQRFGLVRMPYWLPLLEEVRRCYSSGFRPSKSRKGLTLVTDSYKIDFQAIGRVLRALLDELAIDPARGVDQLYYNHAWLDEFIAGIAGVLISLAPEHKSQQEAKRGEA